MPSKKPKKINKRKIALTTGIVLAVVILFDLIIGGTIKYYATWLSCGEQPVAIKGSGYYNAQAATYYHPSTFSVFPGTQQYFCTAFEAEKRGYSSTENGYTFPVLKSQNALCQKLGDPESETMMKFPKCR